MTDEHCFSVFGCVKRWKQYGKRVKEIPTESTLCFSPTEYSYNKNIYVGKHQSFQSKKLLLLFKKITDQMLPAG